MAAEEKSSPPPGKRAAIIKTLIALTAGLVLRHRFDHRIAGTIVLCISCVFAVSVVSAGLRGGLHRFEGILTHAVGTLLTVGLLAPFFYLCMFPGRIILLLTGKDPLHRKLDASEKSYWTPIDKTCTREQYRRQS